MAKSYDNDEDGTNAGFRRHVVIAKEECMDALEACYEYKEERVPHKLKRKLAAKTRRYYEELREYRDENQKISEMWEESEVDEIPQLHRSYVKTEVEAPGRTNATRQVARNQLIAMDPEEINHYIEQLNDIRNALKMAVSIPDETPHDDPDHDDLRHMVKLRGQEDAANKIPSGE